MNTHSFNKSFQFLNQEYYIIANNTSPSKHNWFADKLYVKASKKLLKN
jgi:hypothetical protein